MKKDHTFFQECKECWREDVWLKVLTITSIILVISSFIVPPLGIIDGSVLMAVGELTGLGALWEFAKAINKNINAKVKIKELELEINKKKEENEQTYTDSEQLYD